MELQTAKKNFVSHGVMGGVLLVVGIASLFDGAFRRTTETIQEIWMVEFSAGLVLCLFGLVLFGSAVRYLVHMDRIAEYSERKARHRSSKDRRSHSVRPKMKKSSVKESGMESLEGIRLAAVKSGTV